MTLFWRLGAIVALLTAATPAAAQYDQQVAMELKRASIPARNYCLQRTERKAAAGKEASDTYSARRDFSARLKTDTSDQLEAEAASLERRIGLAHARGDDANDTRPNALGDLLARYRAVATQLARRNGVKLRHIEPGNYDHQRDLASIDQEGENSRYNRALLECLEYRDRFPNREWRDSNADLTSGEFTSQPSDETPIGNRWTHLPPANDNALPEKKGADYRVWMTGTFDTGGGLMTLNPAGGRYAYQNGRMSTTRIDGTVMEGRWEQDMSAGKCEDGRYWGRYRLTFTSGGFSGVFGYCEEEPHRIGGFQGQRRGAGSQ